MARTPDFQGQSMTRGETGWHFMSECAFGCACPARLAVLDLLPRAESSSIEVVSGVSQSPRRYQSNGFPAGSGAADHKTEAVTRRGCAPPEGIDAAESPRPDGGWRAGWRGPGFIGGDPRQICAPTQLARMHPRARRHQPVPNSSRISRARSARLCMRANRYRST